jgi:hypothetical protein
MGRIFAYWAIFYFGLLLNNDKSSENYWATFTSVDVIRHFWPKNGFGYILGDSFSNSSGHPGAMTLEFTITTPAL